MHSVLILYQIIYVTGTQSMNYCAHSVITAFFNAQIEKRLTGISRGDCWCASLCSVSEASTVTVLSGLAAIWCVCVCVCVCACVSCVT